MKEFNAFIREFKAGHLDATLTAKLQELVESVGRYQQKGKLTVEITLKPKDEGEVLTSVKFKMKAPERDTMDSIMFATPENNLVDTNPNQPELFERPVASVKDRPASIVKAL
jgi:hypothetical protein